MKARPDLSLTQEFLKSWLHYNPETGIFRWIKKPNRCIPLNSEAGHLEKNGYLRIRLNNKVYGLHRLAWFYMTGTWPIPTCDHKDGNPRNNKWDNLRNASSSQNSCNIGLKKTNTSGIKGVAWDSARGKWITSIKIKGRSIHIGRFSCIREAEKAVIQKRSEYHGEFTNHGQKKAGPYSH